MNIGQFKKYIEQSGLPDEMPMGILDLTTDDPDDANYPINEKTIHVDDYVNFDQPDVIAGKMLYITIENNLNENPI